MGAYQVHPDETPLRETSDVIDGIVLPTVDMVVLLHQMQLRRFGGGDGLRDSGLLESAVSRAGQYLAYAPEADTVGAAVRMCQGILQNHAFVDGNKRTAFAALTVSLSINGYALDTEPVTAAEMVIDMAAGRVSPEAFEAWVRRSVVADITYSVIEERSAQESCPGNEPDGPGM